MEDLSLGVYDEKFQDPLAAANYLESIRWPNGPVKRLSYSQTRAIPQEGAK